MRTCPFISNYLQSSGWELAKEAFLTLDRSEAVEMAVDTRRATEAPANVLYGTLRRPGAPACGSRNTVDTVISVAAVDRV